MTLPLPKNYDSTPMGANLTADGQGATFRCWAPKANRIWLCLGDCIQNEKNPWQPPNENELVRRGDDFFGFKAGVKDGDTYKFFVQGNKGAAFKRDPYGRELIPDSEHYGCVVRNPANYKWQSRRDRLPRHDELVLYQLHVGVFYGPDRPNRVAKFLDLLDRLDHLANLGINGVQLLPVVEYCGKRSLGYEGTDHFALERDYIVPPGNLAPYLERLNRLRNRTGWKNLESKDLIPHGNQLKAVIDLFHQWGIAVFMDLVFNHADGDIIENLPESFWNFEQDSVYTKDNWSQYYSNRDHTGPAYDLSKDRVRAYLIDNAKFFVQEYQVDGFRFDEVSAIRFNVN